MKKKVLLCGATGFIGRNILERLYAEKEYDIIGTYYKSKPIENYDIQWQKVDLRNQQEISTLMENINIVMQFAATTSGAKDIIAKPYIHVTDNAVINSLILREAYEKKIENFIFPSCSIMYKSSNKPIMEDDFKENQDISKKYYGAGHTKVYLEKMCKFYSNFKRTKHTVIRQSNLYGPHDKYDLEKSHMFGATICKVYKALENGNITVWGTGEEERDLLYVEDLVDFILIALRNQVSEFELANCSYGKSFSVNEIVKKIIYHSGKNISIDYDDTKPTINSKMPISNKKAFNVFNWKPKISFDEGIKKTLKWYENNIINQ